MALVPGFVTLPDVPPGANPFPAYLAALDYYAYSRPSHGFEARLAVLLAITVFSVAGCFVLLGLYWLSHKRTPNPGPQWWMFKQVKRPEGTWIITNMKLLIPVKGIVDLVLAFFYIIDIWLVYVNHAPQYYLGGLRVGVTTPMLLGGWALSFGSISSYLIMPNSFRPSFLTPALVNLFYIGLGVPGFAAHLGLVIWEGVLYSQTYGMLVRAMSELESLGRAWDAGADTSAALETFLAGPFTELGNAFQYYQKLSSASYSILFLAAGGIFLINFAYILLLVIVRRQIFLKVDDIQRHSWTNALVTTTDSTACSEARRDSGWTDGSAPTLYEEVFGRRMSRAQIREMANPKGQNQVSRIDSARQIMALQRAEYDLAIISVLVLCLAGGGAVFCLLIAVFYFKNLYFTNSWPLLELCNTIPVWGWAGITILLKSFLIHNAYINLPPPPLPPVDMDVEGAKELPDLLLPQVLGSPQLHDIVLRKESVVDPNTQSFGVAGIGLGMDLHENEGT